MDWRDLGEALRDAGLPALGGAVAGPAGVLVGQTIARKLGAAEASPDVLRDAIAADPDAMRVLNEMEHEKTERLRIDAERETTLAQVAATDTANARSTPDQDRARPKLAIVAFFLLVLTMGAYAYLDPADPQVWLLVIGAEIGWVGLTMNFYFGTSIGSSKRADEISAMMKARQ